MRFVRRILFVAALCVASLVALTPRVATALPPTGHAVPASAPIDINTATIDQLKTLPGIGDAYAKRIIAGRPYSAKNQLVDRGIIPQGVYDKISDKIVAHRAGK